MQASKSLSRCRSLQHAHFAVEGELVPQPNASLNKMIMAFLAHKLASLTSLRLYDCDAQMLALVNSNAATLVELHIARFFAAKSHDEVLPLKELKKLERLNLCSTWFPLKVEWLKNNEVVGSRTLESVIYALKGSLTELHLGDYVWDEFIIYIAELCKELEVVSL